MKPIMNFCRSSILAALACWMCLSAGALGQGPPASAPRRSKEFPALKELMATRISALDSEMAEKTIKKATASDDEKRVIDFAYDLRFLQRWLLTTASDAASQSELQVVASLRAM